LSTRCIDLTGQKFGRLTVISRGENDSHGTARWLCLCECGNIKLIRGDKLRHNEIMSCGCYQAELRKSTERAENISKAKTRHGMSNTKLYYVYNNMIRRCYSPNNERYNNYGDRGIIVCNEWRNNIDSFFEWAIATGYTDGLTLDRINVNGNYCPENCRWASQKVQANNRTSNAYITHNGETHTIAEWSDITGLSPKLLYQRKRLGWDDSRILTEPVRHNKHS